MLYHLFQDIFEPELLEEIKHTGLSRIFAEGSEIIQIGQRISHFPLVLSGSVKVFTEKNEDREYLLYYLETGDTCAMTLQCCLGNFKSNIKAVAESDSELIMIPVQFMEEWMAKYPTWQRFILISYNERFKEMQEVIDNLVFEDLRGRLLKYLREKAIAASSHILNLTHVKIAEEISSSRVVISRLLKTLERDKVLKIGRGNIQLMEDTY